MVLILIIHFVNYSLLTYCFSSSGCFVNINHNSKLKSHWKKVDFLLWRLVDVFISELQTLSFLFLADSRPVLNAKNDPNELIFCFLKGILENGDSHEMLSYPAMYTKNIRLIM